ncbi:MAG TPA: AMP-binding protein [Thermodesulfobacteriota bacterium]
MTLRELLDRAAAADPSRPYLLHGGASVPLGHLVQGVDALATSLHALGVRRDDHVALLLPNRPEFIYVWFALATLGAVTVPLDPALTRRELHEALLHADAVALVTDAARLEVAAAAREGTGVRWMATADDAPPGGYGLADLLAGPVGRRPDAPRDDRAVAAIVYTSGTTGAPRGILKTHRSYTRVAEAVVGWLEATPADRVFVCLPLFHTNAQVYGVLSSLACGGSLALETRFSASRFWDQVTASGATLFTYLGTMLTALARAFPTPAERWHDLRAGIGGGATAAVERVFCDRFGVRLVELYALAETSTVTVRPLAASGPAGSAGWPTPWCRVRLLDEAGGDAAPGSVGEIAVAAADVLTPGYYKDPAGTAASRRGEWFLTGDLGRLDARGALHVVGRKTDRIRCRGEWVAPIEVESVLLAHPAVAEAAVVGRPSELGDEEVCAVVVPADGAAVSADELRAFCRARLAPYKVPAVIELREALPKTATEKVRRRALREVGRGA